MNDNAKNNVVVNIAGQSISNASASEYPAAQIKPNNYLADLLNFLVFLPALVYLGKVKEYATNIPYADDYDAILDFLSKFKEASFTDKFFLLFSQHIDHRIFHSRVIYVVYYYLLGNVNFTALTFIANLQLVVIFLVIIHFIKKAIPGNWHWVCPVAGLCIFDLSNYENATIAMFGMQNYGVIMLFVLGLFFYTKSGTKSIVLGALFQSICIFSSSSGMFYALFLFLFLLARKEKLKIITSGAVLVICAALFFIHFSRSTSSDTAFSLLRDVRFFFLMLGAHFSYSYGLPIGIMTFALLLLCLPVTIRKNKIAVKDHTLPFVCILSALLCNIAVISVARNAYMGELGAYSSHYLILTHLIVAILFVFLWIRFQGRKIMWPLTISAALILLYAYIGNYEYGDGYMAVIKKRKESIPYCYGQFTEDYMSWAKGIAQRACSDGIYCIQDER